jgi:membrane-associated protease RseP (regulator of RpoE activity)
MRRAACTLRLGLLSWSTWVLAVLLFVAPTAASAGTAARAEVQPLVTFGEASTEISFPAPTRHAVVLQQYRAVERITHADPVLLSLDGTRAVLEVEVVRSHMPPTGISANVGAPPDPLPVPPARLALDAGLLSHVRIQEVGRGLYEVKGADVQALLEDAGRVLADLAPIVLPIPSFQTGLQYRITSTASDGIISRQGFTVTAPKLAQRAGIETGDTILSVNGRPVNGFASLYTIYREVGRDPTLNTVQVELKRQGTRLTKTYRIR